MSEEFMSQDDSLSSSSDQPVFDIDQMSVNSDNQKAIQYLQKVREEAKQAPKCTYFEEGEDFQFKQTDPKYLIQPKGVKLNGKWAMNSLWQKDVVEQYYSFKRISNNLDNQIKTHISCQIIMKKKKRKLNLVQKEMLIQRTIERYCSNPLHLPHPGLPYGIQNYQVAQFDSKVQLQSMHVDLLCPDPIGGSIEQ